jgi:simple sugar transport system substrate-binding protein
MSKNDSTYDWAIEGVEVRRSEIGGASLEIVVEDSGLRSTTHAPSDSGEGSGADFSRRGFLGTVGAGGAATLRGFLSTVAAGGAAVALGSERSLAQSSRKKLAMVTHIIDPFYVPAVYGAKEFCKYAGWDFQFAGPQTPFNIAQVVDVLDRVLVTKPDALAMVISDPSAYDPAIEKALAAGIAVLCFNVNVKSVLDKYKIPFIGQDNVNAGYTNGMEAADFAVKAGKKSGEIVIGQQSLATPNILDRTNGTIKALQDYNAQNGTTFTWSTMLDGVDENRALPLIQAKWTKDQDNIIGFANTGWETWFIGDFIEQNNLHGRFFNGGFDTLPGVMVQMAKGNVQWALNQNPYAQGWITAALAYMQVVHGYKALSYASGPEVDTMENYAIVDAREKFWAGVHVSEIK